jgi:hypothetical protein
MTLPYTAEILYALFGQLNRGLWPLQAAGYLLTLLAVAQAARPVPGGDRTVGLLLAAGWAWVAWQFFYLSFAQLNFMAPLYAAGFAVQAVLLAGYGALGALRLRLRRDGWSLAGLLLVGLALAGLPLLEALLGHGWPETPLVWIAPGPSVVATLGLLALCPRPPLVPALVPVLWGLVAGTSAWVLDMPGGLATAAAILAGAAVAVARRVAGR